MARKHSRLATIVARVFDPVFEIPLALGFAVWFAVANGLRWRFLILLLLVDAFMPFIFFLHLLRKGEVSNWDIRDRKERLPLYAFTILAHLVGVLLAFFLEKYLLLSILLSFYVVAVVFMAITMYWKVSLHMGVNSLLITFINVVTEWRYWWLYILLLVVGWARVRNGHHDWLQVIIGSILGGGLFLAVFSLFSKIFS